MRAVTQFYLADENQEQSVYELFSEYLSSIYFEGYAELLESENPTAFNFEFTQFITNNL